MMLIIAYAGWIIFDLRPLSAALVCVTPPAGAAVLGRVGVAPVPVPVADENDVLYRGVFSLMVAVSTVLTRLKFETAPDALEA